MRFLLSVLFFGLATSLVSQPVLTQSNFVPTIGDMQLYYIADTSTALDNTTGANVIFDYTGMRGDGTTQSQYTIDPLTTPFVSHFPAATFTDTTEGFPNNHRYSRDFADSLNVLGAVIEVNTIGTVIGKYDLDNETVMQFPFAFGDSFIDTYSGQFTSAGLPLATQGNGIVRVAADAWGTLKLPMTPDIDSVLRILRVENLLTDTIFLQPLFPNILPIPINARIVSYYKPSISKQPLLSYTVADVDGDTTVSIVSQYPMFGVGVEERKREIGIGLFPNPVSKEKGVRVSLTNELETPTTISLYNTTGQLLELVFQGNLKAGKHDFFVETANLSRGIYLIKVNKGTVFSVEKLVVK